MDGQVGIFDGQSDIGGPVIAGNASYDSGPRTYTINSAGYNIWYTRDEFHYIWKKVSGDVSLSADISFPNPDGYGDRKVVLVIRQDLEDDSREAMVALHGAGLIHLAQRPSKGANIRETFRMQAKGQPDTAAGTPAAPKRLGIEKRGDSIALFVSLDGGPMHQSGEATTLHFDGTYYVGIGFCSHMPDKSDTATVSNVVLEQPAAEQPAAGQR